MATYTWPDDLDLMPQSMEWHVNANSRAARSSLSAFTQTTSLPGGWWGMVLNFGAQNPEARAKLEAWLTKLNGMQHRVSLWDMGHGRRNGLPLGTINTTGVTVLSTAAQFAETVTLAGAGAGNTLLDSDLLSINGQLLKVVDAATANGSGQITVNIRQGLRAQALAGAAVTLIKPRALFVLTSPSVAFPRSPGRTCPAFSVELMEVPA